ncbi:MAG: ATP-dependent Clp protease proteolytic subunit [Clostridia bacterium]|nr:ATP-dependent Clp protease proteolytic subunit [Clostridia bacterium]
MDNFDIKNTIIPSVIETTSRGERSYDIYSRLLNDRIIFLSDVIDSNTASLVIAELLFLEAQDRDKDIYLYINSPGGSVSAGLAIYDTMNFINCDVSTICMGMAASMGAFLLACGTKGKRFALPNSEIMIHQPLIQEAGGKATDMRIIADHIVKMRKKLDGILSEVSGKSLAEIEAATESDNYMSASEAKAFGLVDDVITHR